jgi:hypothetical protein
MATSSTDNSVGPRLRVETPERIGPAVVRELVGLLANPRPIRSPVPVLWREVVAVSARPGVGGRRNRAPRGVDSEATRELRELLGTPQIYRHKRVRVEVYEHTPHGNGIVAVRMSDKDVQNGETALGQARTILEMCDRKGLRPRRVVVSLNCNSTIEYEDRLDWAMIRHGAEAGWLTWVAYREPDRVSRNELAARTFFRDLKELGISLWLGETGRAVDLDDPS